jgi:hypothetical protein
MGLGASRRDLLGPAGGRGREDRGVTIEELRRTLNECRERVESIGRHL